MSSASSFRDGDGSRLGGARADFVASLGRRVASARELLATVEDDPASMELRDELRRRLHALASGARLLGFQAIARSLNEVLAVFDRIAQAGELTESDVRFSAQALDDLPALAWDDGRQEDPAEAPAEAQSTMTKAPPSSVLVIGDESLADALLEEPARDGRAFECERCDDLSAALHIARTHAPDLALVDVDLAESSAFVETLLDDPLTEPVPIVVVGTFKTTDGAARFVALGVGKTLTKPASPAVIRAACNEILDGREGRTQRMTLGDPTLEQLAVRLGEEIERGLVTNVVGSARTQRVSLGEGTEVLGALWGAIARVQEIVTQKSNGAIRFGGNAPEGAIALAPWLHQDLAASDRLAARGRGTSISVRMIGRRVVVADDDPGVTWFISDLLRTAGCEVYEALDGVAALELCFRVGPELVVSDILMPGLDGFALSRALRRDVALSDTPVILLSWKEDLLQRVRELGASAAAYMRKETDSRTILARVREVLLPRERVEARLRTAGEMRGRLDGLSPRRLLDMVCSLRKDARVSIRDAAFAYEVDIRNGAPRKATRTASDGAFQSGERVFASVLGLSAGRFVVSDDTTPVRGDLSGTLIEQLAAPIAAARGALASTTGTATMRAAKVVLDRNGLAEYLRATPDPARSLIARLADGASPRSMLVNGEVSPTLLEDILADLAARGTIRAVEDENGTDLLGPAVAAALDVVRGCPRPNVGAVHDDAESFAISASRSEGAPSPSLEDAVMREISSRSPFPGPARSTSPEQPPIIEPSNLIPRSPLGPSGAGIVTDDRTSAGASDVVSAAPGSELGSRSAMAEPQRAVPGRAIGSPASAHAKRAGLSLYALIFAFVLLAFAIAVVVYVNDREDRPLRHERPAAPP
jgi:DNA-binding response OmpR family regulator